MNRIPESAKHSLAVALVSRLLTIAAVLMLAGTVVSAQNPELQEKLAQVKQAAALNQQALHQYQWTETTQLTLKGDPKPASQKLCQYGPDGQVQKTPIRAAGSAEN